MEQKRATSSTNKQKPTRRTAPKTSSSQSKAASSKRESASRTAAKKTAAKPVESTTRRQAKQDSATQLKRSRSMKQGSSIDLSGNATRPRKAPQEMASAAPQRKRRSTQTRPNTAQRNQQRRVPSQNSQQKQAVPPKPKQKQQVQLSPKMRIVAIILAVLLAVGVFDFFANKDKAYSGVHIGAVDCSGKTQDEITSAILETYDPIINGSEICVYVSEEAKQQVEATGETETGSEDQLSVEDARDQRLVFVVDAEDLSASIDAQTSAQKALEAGRGITGVFRRIQAFTVGYTIEPDIAFGENYTDFVNEVNATVGSERVDWNIAIEEGFATITEGWDGELVDDEVFTANIIHGLLAQQDNPYSFVAVAQHAPVRITQDAAEKVASQVNNAIADGASFIYEGVGWNATPSMVGEWIETNIIQDGKSWKLVPSVNDYSAKHAILGSIKTMLDEQQIDVSFKVNDDNKVFVVTKTQGRIPLIDNAIADLNTGLFGSDSEKPQEAALAEDGKAVLVNMASTDVPEEMSFDDAMNAGVISRISTYTTSYTYGTSSTETRNFNIHRAAELLDKSICRPGESWSFHGTAGECNEEAGFQEAGVINEGIYSTSYGGGICQVATTVFNAVYEAGYYIDRRHNHTLYNSAYPAGRDAAVSWPDLDLIWSNDTNSDILLTTAYTEGTVTVSLYGVDPERTVDEWVSDWEEGAEYKKKYIVDETLSPKGSYVKTYGSNGRSIVVERTVYDKDGEQVSFQRFNSYYDPLNEIIQVGTEYEIPDEDKE